MRVAVHHPERTEEDGTVVPASVSAYRLGRVDDFVNPVTGETTPKAEVAKALLEQAQAEFPGQDVKLEELQDNGDGTSEWVPTGEALAKAQAGEAVEHLLTAEQPQAAQGGAPQ